MDRAADRIERFLADHPDGDLLICVGYASAWGVAWLVRRCRGRRVRLLIGDTRQRFGWEHVAQADRDDCLEFLRSDTVEVRNWYRTDKSAHGPASAHLKAWMVHRGSRPLAALNGSANLSRNGLEANVEAMTEAHGRDLAELWEKANRLWGRAWERGDRLATYLEQPNHEPPPVPPSAPSPPGQPPFGRGPASEQDRAEAWPSRRRRIPTAAAVTAAVCLLLAVGAVRACLPVEPRPPIEPVQPDGRADPQPGASTEPDPRAEADPRPDPRAEADPRQAAVEVAQEHASAAEAAAAKAAAVGERAESLPESILSVNERRGLALGRVMVAEDCAAKAAASAGAASSARDAAGALEAAEQAAGHRECAEAAADAAQQWADEAERWLAAECMDDLFTQRSHLESEWRPGWEFGCEAHVPDAVPCVYLNPVGPRYLEPGYVGTAGECRANTAILSRPEGWYECLPDDGSRWRGNWAADPINGRDLCP